MTTENLNGIFHKMNEKSETFPEQSVDAALATDQSIFYDRREGYFLRWMLAQGLAPDANDAEIAIAMEAHCDTHNTVSISE